jgi:hypothetical protein
LISLFTALSLVIACYQSSPHFRLSSLVIALHRLSSFFTACHLLLSLFTACYLSLPLAIFLYRLPSLVIALYRLSPFFTAFKIQKAKSKKPTRYKLVFQISSKKLLLKQHFLNALFEVCA